MTEIPNSKEYCDCWYPRGSTTGICVECNRPIFYPKYEARTNT